MRFSGCAEVLCCWVEFLVKGEKGKEFRGGKSMEWFVVNGLGERGSQMSIVQTDWGGMW